MSISKCLQPALSSNRAQYSDLQASVSIIPSSCRLPKRAALTSGWEKPQGAVEVQRKHDTTALVISTHSNQVVSDGLEAESEL